MKLLYSGPVLWWMRAVPPVGLGMQRALSREAFSDQPQPGWWLPQMAANFAAPHTQRTYQEEMSRYAEGDASTDPVAVGLPMLILHGDDDRLAPLAIGKWTKEHARKAELVVIDGGSHMIPITHTEQLTDRIEAFVRGG
jgi:pimeloyl-ACP methyl ester carboxylesterase